MPSGPNVTREASVSVAPELKTSCTSTSDSPFHVPPRERRDAAAVGHRLVVGEVHPSILLKSRMHDHVHQSLETAWVLPFSLGGRPRSLDRPADRCVSPAADPLAPLPARCHLAGTPRPWLLEVFGHYCDFEAPFLGGLELEGPSIQWWRGPDDGAGPSALTFSWGGEGLLWRQTRSGEESRSGDGDDGDTAEMWPANHDSPLGPAVG